jgi:23S rRNA pseudouridine2457 synthase
LVLLTNVGWLQSWISHPHFKLPKTYWVQIEGVPDEHSLQRLASGVALQDGVTQPARVSLIEPPALWPRTPPIRERQHIPTSWISMTIIEGRNRQVRRMTAAVGHPTLRLIRCAVGPWELGPLQPGEWRDVRPPRDRQEMARIIGD